MKNFFLVALVFGAAAVSAFENDPPQPEPTPGPPVPAPAPKIVCPTDRSQCIDEHVSCQGWSMRGVVANAASPSSGDSAWMEMKSAGGKGGKGECATNPDYMLKRCSQSCCTICNTCPGDTKQWPTVGMVPLNIDMAKNAHTLQNLDETITPESYYDQCQKDKHDLCPQWAEEGECEDRRYTNNIRNADAQTNHLWMHVNCMSSCCPGCPKSCPSSSSMCSNNYSSDSSCLRWSQAGECNRNPTWMQENCANECCPICRPAPVPVRPQPLSYPQQRYGNPYPTNPYGPYNIYG